MRGLTRQTAWRPCLLLLGVGFGCVGSPQPIPPTFNPDSIQIESPVADVATEIVELPPLTVVGGPGSVAPAVGVVVATPLDSTLDLLTEPVREDGSFSIMVSARQVRLQVRDGAARSEPMDLELNDTGLTPFSPQPCVEISPHLEHDFGVITRGTDATTTVTIDNRCDEELTLNVALRTADRDQHQPFAIPATPPSSVPAGASVSFPLSATPGQTGSFEETLLVDIGSEDLRAVTLFLRGQAE